MADPLHQKKVLVTNFESHKKDVNSPLMLLNLSPALEEGHLQPLGYPLWCPRTHKDFQNQGLLAHLQG